MSLADYTNEQLVGAIALCAADVRDELLRRLSAPEEETFVLPVSVSEAIRNHFGSGQRTFTAMVKRVRFAYKVWQGKYGPWTPEQAEYAEELCLWAINQAAQGTNPGHARARAYTCLDRILHDERTHEGFKRREGDTFDISADIREAFSS